MSGPFSYWSKHAVVTGGATGVGAALLDVLAELDAGRVTVLDVKPPSGLHDVYIETDLSQQAEVDAAVRAKTRMCTRCSTTRVSPTRSRPAPSSR